MTPLMAWLLEVFVIIAIILILVDIFTTISARKVLHHLEFYAEEDHGHTHKSPQ